jgi:hypothetical protein
MRSAVESNSAIGKLLADEYQARILARDKAFSGEVVQRVECDNDRAAYIVEADRDRVMVPQIADVEMAVGDDVEVSRDKQGNYQVEIGYGYGR